MTDDTPAWAKQPSEKEAASEDVANASAKAITKHVTDIVRQREQDGEMMFWDNEQAQEKGELFGELVDNNEQLTENWQGWKDCGGFGISHYIRGTQYFREQIKAKAYANEEEAREDAKEVLSYAARFKLGGADGESLDNCFIRNYGIDEKEFIEEFSDELAKIFIRCWKVGEAEYRYNVKKALTKLASDGNLDAQKTVLTATGDLTPEGGGGSGKTMYIILDNDDLEA